MKTDFLKISKTPNVPEAPVNRNTHNSKKKKYKDLQFKTLANNFLSNISLTVDDDNLKNRLDAVENTKKLYFEKIISNEFDCFLSFNKINTKPDKQTEYFNYYKERVLSENSSGNRFSNFLHNEFNEKNVPKFYVDNVLAKTKESETEPQKRPTAVKLTENVLIPSIKILNINTNQKVVANDLGSEEHPSSSVISNKLLPQDLEIDYLKQTVENGSLQLNNSNLTLSSTSSNSIHLANSLALAASSSKTRPKLSSRDSDQNVNASHSYSRTLSESSAESTYSNIAIIGSRNQQNTLVSTNSKSGVLKRSLFQNLRRLTNEKLIMTSNNSPIGIFSRKLKNY
jgi:hypothetical protein